MIKKILSIVVLGLLICNTGFSKIYEMNNCYVYKFSDGSTTSSWDEYKKKIYNETNEDYSDVIYSINLDTGTVSQIVKYSNGLVKFDDFIIQNYSSDFIVALHEKVNNKLTIDLKNLKVQSYIKINTSIRVSFTQCINRSDTTETSEEGGSSGTAFFVSNRGHLITNNHVVEGCSVSKITYKNSDYDTKLIATDKNLDLALLKAEIRPKSFFNFSKDDIKKLNKVYVAGYPLGKGLSDDLKISSGIVSSLKGYKDNSNEIQIDAPINPGNSGGPIINENGDLIAIAVSGLAKDQTEGINFGIKSSAAELFLRSNKITPKKSMYSGMKDNDKLLEILEQGTVYTYCD